MSTLIVMADEGMDLFVDDYFSANAIKVKLFCNDHTPVRGDTVASYTEAAGGGYVAKTLGAASHTVVTESLPHYLSWPSQTFIFDGPLTTNDTVYGYFVTNNAGTVLFWAQLLDTPFVPTQNGDNIPIDPCMLQYSGGVPS